MQTKQPSMPGILSKLLNQKGLAGFLIFAFIGAFSVLGHAPFYFWPVTILCLALLFLGLNEAAKLNTANKRTRRRRAGFMRAYGFGFGYFLAGLYWIGSAFIVRGEEFAPFAPLAVIILCAGLAFFWGLAGFAHVSICRGKKPDPAFSLMSAFIFVCVFFLAEYFRANFFIGFPWNMPGYVFAAGKPISQFASITGIYGLNILVLFLAAGLGVFLYNRKYWQLLAGGFLSLVLISLWGAHRLSNAQIIYHDKALLRIVHANIPQKDKFDPDKYVANINKYLVLSKSPGFENITHIIWPEGAVPGLMLEDKALMMAISQSFSNQIARPPIFVTQTLRSETDGQKTRYFNSALAINFNKDGTYQTGDFYDKHKLVPFGEYIPAQNILEKVGLKTLTSAMESLSAGDLSGSPSIPGLPPLAYQICYEIIFPSLSDKSAPKTGEKAKWILNLSNDSWYGNSTGPRQHINQARYRAVEEGLPVIRATSGGISGLIDAYGRQVNQLGIADEGIIDTKLPINHVRVFYKPFINHILLLIIVIILIVCILVIREKH